MKVNPCADVMMRLINALEASDVSVCWFRLFGTVLSFPSINESLNISHNFVFNFSFDGNHCGLRIRELDAMSTPCTKTTHTTMTFFHHRVDREGSMGQFTNM